ncbi:hypothetical protein GCM10027073_57810 [Streptomyces chlorus]|uniref:Uncharacterized protein n=1 Tax=Streptomyces chlorus TaxID=887452 RepID=A0ABW1EBD5_9ACTN
MSERPAVRLLVVPFTSGTFPGSGQIFTYLEGPVPHLDWMERIALSPQASRDFIRDIANSL